MFESGQKVVCVDTRLDPVARQLTHGGVYTVAWCGRVKMGDHVTVIGPDGRQQQGGSHHLVKLVEVRNMRSRCGAFSALRFRPLRSTEQGMQVLREILERTPEVVNA